MDQISQRDAGEAVQIETFVSVVVVCENQADQLSEFLNSCQPYLAEHFSDYEILCVDQASRDGTRERVRQLSSSIQGIRIIGLASVIANDVAISAGLENAIGDYVVLMDLETDPLDIIKPAVLDCRRGKDLIVGITPRRDAISYRLVRPFVDGILASVGYKLPKHSTGFRCLSRYSVNLLTRTNKFYEQILLRMSNSGLSSNTLQYEQTAPPDRRSLTPAIYETLRIVVFSSTKPLRWMSTLGISGSLIAFGIATFSVVTKVMKDDVVEGWASMVVFMSLLFMLLFTLLAFFGEYLGRLLNEIGTTESYTVVYDEHSQVMLNEERVNVMADTSATSGEHNG